MLSIQNNTVAVPTATQIGGRSWQEYTYDDLNRLTTASGNFVGRNDNGVGFNHSKYTLAMSYDSQHNITSKIQNHETATSTSSSSVAGAWTQVEQTAYNLNYQDYNTASYSVAGYNYTQPHAPRTIVDQPNLAGCCDAANDPRVKTKKFDYDRNGNQTRITSNICTSTTPDVLRENLWDEENRLRAIDLNPEANTVHPIAIYTYDAGGERIIKQNATSVAIYENALQVGTTIKNDFMLYPSGMLVARPAADGTGALSYTKHYFAGSQRVSSKIGTTSNLGKFLQDWTLIENSSGGAPINLVSTSHNQLTVAETGVTHVYTQFGITPTPTFSSNTAFLPIASFTATGTETEQFWFHPDHLGSSNYITNFVGEVSQHMEYFAFGETFIEEHKNSHNSPYKFNGKELDEESGYYYYGARYYSSRENLWLSVDPLANFNPFMDDEFYIDGDHNGGVYNSFNHATYTFCYQSPINLVDPNGKQVNWGKLWNRTTGALQMIGGLTEAVVGGVGGVVTAETGIGAALGYAVLVNGCDNTVTGFNQMWTGESQTTLLHKGVKATSLALGANENVAENIATGADISTIVLGSVNTAKALKAKSMTVTSQSDKYLILPGVKFKTNKLEQHASDWKLVERGQKVTAKEVNVMKKIVNRIIRGASSVRQGKWANPNAGGFNNAIFYSNGRHVVVTQADGTLITVLKNGAGNKHFDNAKTLWHK